MVVATSDSTVWEQFKETQDRSLRQQLILRYAPLVKYVVGRMAIGLPGILDGDDIISYATIGLIDAVERFDPERGLKFETYAIPRIRGSILDAMRRLGTYPRGARRKMKRIEAAIASLEECNGRTPTDQEVADHLGLSLEAFSKEMRDASFSVVPLGRTSLSPEDDESLPLVDVIEDTQSPSPSAEVERTELRAELLQAINELPERERLLISLYYNEELTLKEISQVLEVSESRVCQLHSRAILKLRKSLAEAKATMPRSGMKC